MAPAQHRTWAALVGGERSHHCTIPALFVIYICSRALPISGSDRRFNFGVENLSIKTMSLEETPLPKAENILLPI